MQTHSLVGLTNLGQSIWLDYIDRNIFQDGTVEDLIARDRLPGLTSNPAIFEKAIAQGGQYTQAISRLQAAGATLEEIYEELVLSDIGLSADCFRPVYEASGGHGGYVRFEVSRLLSCDTEDTLAEVRELWKRLARRPGRRWPEENFQPGWVENPVRGPMSPRSRSYSGGACM